MKRGFYLALLPILLVLMAACSTSRQVSIANDDVYYNGVRTYDPVLVSSSPSTMTNRYDRNRYGRSSSRIYDDSYDYYYSSRINRFYRPYSGLSFYSGCYTNYRYYDRFYSGWNIYGHWGTPYYYRPYYCNSCWGHGWNSYTYFYNPYPFGYHNHWNRWHHGYYYNNFYYRPYNSYYNGFYNEPISSRGRYIGPRSTYSSNIVAPSPRSQSFVKSGSGKSDNLSGTISPTVIPESNQNTIQQEQNTNTLQNNTPPSQSRTTEIRSAGNSQSLNDRGEGSEQVGQVSQSNSTNTVSSEQRGSGNTISGTNEIQRSSQRSLTNTKFGTVATKERTPRTYTAPLKSLEADRSSSTMRSLEESSNDRSNSSTRQQVVERESTQRNYTTRTNRYDTRQYQQETRSPRFNDTRQPQRSNTYERQEQNSGSRWIDRSYERQQQQPQRNSRTVEPNNRNSRNSNNGRTVQPSRSNDWRNSQPRTQPSRTPKPNRSVQPPRNSGGSGSNRSVSPPPSRNSGGSSGNNSRRNTPSRNSGGRR